MGLGPPVCMNCMLIYRLDDNGWHCAACGDTMTKTHLWTVATQDQRLIEDNTRFMREVWAAQEEVTDETKQ